MTTTVVNIKDTKDYDVYVGREVKNKHHNLNKSFWANPYFLRDEEDRDKIFEDYSKYIKLFIKANTKDIDYINQKLDDLKGKRLACWCKEEIPMPNNDEMKQMSMDDYIQWMFDNNYYDVDIETGRVLNPRTNELLKGTINLAGYDVVGLVYTRKVVRQAKVHRMIAIKKYGLESVIGKHIAHLDQNKLNNHWSNLQPMNADDHVRFDGTNRNLVHGKMKETWLPCVRCGNPDGILGIKTPQRISGKRFGIEGKICRTCYGALQERERRAKANKKCHADLLAKLADMTYQERIAWANDNN